MQRSWGAAPTRPGGDLARAAVTCEEGQERGGGEGRGMEGESESEFKRVSRGRAEECGQSCLLVRSRGCLAGKGLALAPLREMRYLRLRR